MKIQNHENTLPREKDMSLKLEVPCTPKKRDSKVKSRFINAISSIKFDKKISMTTFKGKGSKIMFSKNTCCDNKGKK